jgi:hypothetical protein
VYIMASLVDFPFTKKSDTAISYTGWVVTGGVTVETLPGNDKVVGTNTGGGEGLAGGAGIGIGFESTLDTGDGNDVVIGTSTGGGKGIAGGAGIAIGDGSALDTGDGNDTITGTGTGSYGIAALSLGRKFIGVEHDAKRFSGAAERLKSHG